MEATMEAPRSLRHVDDGHLVTRIRSGHPLAVVELVRRYDEILIHPGAYRVLGNWADAEDVCSELVVRLLALSMKRDREDQAGWPPADVPAWLATVVRRLAVDMKRSRDAEWERRVHQPEPCAKESMPYENAEVREVVRRLEEGLHDLTKEEREAVQLLICRDVPVRVACKAAGVSKATLYRRRDRALVRLRQSGRLRKLFEDSFGPRERLSRSP
jgi:RNA polymerase sigma factor (sigma-70 family)